MSARKPIGKFPGPAESERFIGLSLVITGTRIEAQFCRREVRLGSNSHCLLGREFKKSETYTEEAVGHAQTCVITKIISVAFLFLSRLWTVTARVQTLAVLN